MSIIVGRIENKFWNNSEYKFPNGFPIYEAQEELKDVEPNMNSFATGTVYLFGDNWNHCIYNGAYYSLYIQEVIDEDRKFYTYRLERDFWFDVLRLRPSVVGDLVTSNNDELLEKNLNRTVAAIDNPARVITINFGEVEFDWRKNIDFKLAETPIIQKVLALKEFNRFIDSADCTFASKWKEIDKAFYSKSKNPAVFILDILKPSTLLTGWKNLLRNRVNEFIKNINQTPKTELKLAKLALTGKNAASPLNGKYCITQKVEGIATGEESDSYKIKQIDLSGLKDIIPVNLHDLQEVTPTTNLLRGTKNGLFLNVETQASEKFFAKIKRKAYVPICATPDRRPEELGFGFGGNWNNVRNPQSIFWEYGGTRREEFLWWVDNLNFVIQRTAFPLYTQEGGRNPYTGQGWDSRNVKDNWYTKISPFPIPWTAPDYDQGDEIFPELSNRELVPFGFLIYGIHRDFNLWFLFEYTGTRKLKEIEYINGIKPDFIENYRDENSWWSNLGSSFAGIRKSPEFLRFYLDIYNLGIMALLPGTYYTRMRLGLSYNYPSYLNTDIWGTYELSNYKYYVPKVVTSGIYKKGKLIEESLYSKAKFSEFLNKRQEKFKKLLNFGNIKFPDGFEIAEGDYFFSDLDYEIETRFVWEKGKEKGKDWANFIKREKDDGLAYFRGKLAWEFTHQMRLEDFVKNEEGAGILKVSEGEGLFALCTTLTGNLDVRKIQGFSRTLELSKGPNEIVKEVEGSTQQKVHFSLLKKLSDPLIPEHGEFKITDRLKGKIIKGFYESQGYKVIGEGEVFWNWYEEEDFADSSQAQHLFDLVGTDWYLHIAKGKISLICKDERNLEGTEKTLNSLLYHENEGLNLSLTEKINQKARLQFFTAPYYLNWKTTFTDQDRIFLYSSLIKPTTQQTEFEQYFLRLETQFDRIWYENISIPKRVDRALELADSVRVQSLHLQLIRDQYQYQIDQDRLDLATKRYEESIKKSTIELENQRSLSLISAATSLITGGMSVGSLSRLYRPSRLLKGKRTNIGLYRMFGEDTEIPETPENLGLLSNFQKVGHIHKGVKWTKGGFPRNVNPWGVASFGVNALVGAGRNLIADFAYRFPERERQIGVEKQLGAEELGLSSLTIDTNHMDRQITAQQKLNREINVYNNPAISEREVLDQFRERKEWHGKKLRDIYLVVFVPTAEQLIALESFREEFGVMCDIPNIKINFYEGMEPDIIRYRNLDDKAITGIENLIIREFFKSHLMAGIKIIKTERHTFKLLDAEEYRQQIFRLNKDLYNKDEKITDLQDKVDKAEVICTIQRNELQKRIDSIENQLNNVNAQLNQKVTELTAKEKECAEAKKKLEEEIKKHKIDREEAEQKWDDCKRDYLNEKTAKNALAKEKEELTKRLADFEQTKTRLESTRKELAKKRKDIENMNKQKDNLQEKIKTLETEKEELNNQLKECKSNKSDVESNLFVERQRWRDKEILINSENRRLKDSNEKLGKEKEELEKQKAAVIKDYEQERDDRLSAINELRTCEGEKEKLNKRIQELEKQKSDIEAKLQGKEADASLTDKKAEEANKRAEDYRKQKELLETQKADIERQLRESIAAKAELEKQKEDIQKKFEDCKRNRQQQKTQLEGKIKELQKKIDDAGDGETTPKQKGEVCEVLKKFLSSSYPVDLKKRSNERGEDTGNALRDLVLEIIKETSWMRKTGLDTKLSSKYPAMRPIFETLMEFEEIPLVSKWENAMDSEGWGEYEKMEELRINYQVSDIQNLSNEAKETKKMVEAIIGNPSAGIPTMETKAEALGIKAVLDELNWLTYKVKNELTEQLKTDQDLIYFFAHIYPGESLNLYTTLFGNPNTSIAKRKFIEQVTCGGGSTPWSTILLNYDKNTKFSTSDLGKQTDRKPKGPFIPDVYDIYTSTTKFLTGRISDINIGFSPSRTNVRYPAIIQYRIHKSKYWKSDPKLKGYFSFVWAKFTTKGDKEYGSYISVDQKDAWNKVMGNRNFLWSNRSKIKFPEGPEYRFVQVITEWLLPRGESFWNGEIDAYSSKILVNLEDTFGKEKAKDAAILLGIMQTNKIRFLTPLERDSEGYYSIKIDTKTTNIMAAHRNLPELTDSIFGGMNKAVIIQNEFEDAISCLNYVWRQIRGEGVKTLEDPLGPTYSGASGLKFQEFLNSIWEANQ